jgi:hypothetical protein
LRLAWAVLLEYRVSWFAAVDLGVIALAATLSVAGGLAGASMCRAFSAVIVVVLLLEFVLLCVTRPFTTLLSTVHSATCSPSSASLRKLL